MWLHHNLRFIQFLRHAVYSMGFFIFLRANPIWAALWGWWARLHPGISLHSNPGLETRVLYCVLTRSGFLLPFLKEKKKTQPSQDLCGGSPPEFFYEKKILLPEFSFLSVSIGSRIFLFMLLCFSICLVVFIIHLYLRLQSWVMMEATGMRWFPQGSPW